MAFEPELHIGVRVDPIIDPLEVQRKIQKPFLNQKENLPEIPVKIKTSDVKRQLEEDLEIVPLKLDPVFQNKIQSVIDAELGENKVYSVKIDFDANGFGKKISKQLKAQLRSVNRTLSNHLNELQVNLALVNKASTMLYGDGDGKKVRNLFDEIEANKYTFAKSKSNLKKDLPLDEYLDHTIKCFNKMRDAGTFTGSNSIESIYDLKDALAELQEVMTDLNWAFEDKIMDQDEFTAATSRFSSLRKKILPFFEDLQTLNAKTLKSMGFSEIFAADANSILSFINEISKVRISDNVNDFKFLLEGSNENALEDATERYEIFYNELEKLLTTLEDSKIIKGIVEKENINPNQAFVLDADLIEQNTQTIVTAIGKIRDEMNPLEKGVDNFTNSLFESLEAKTTEIESVVKRLSSVLTVLDNKNTPVDEPKNKSVKQESGTSQKTVDHGAKNPELKNELSKPAAKTTEFADKDDKKAPTNYTAVINKVIFNIEKETLQNTVDELFKDVVAKIGVAPSESSIKSIKQSIQSELKQLPIDMKATTDGDGDGKTIPLNGSIVVDADHITSPTDPIPLIGKIDVPSANITVDGKAIPDVIIDQKPKKTTSKKKKQVEGQISFDDISTEQLETAAEKAAELMNPISLPGSIRIKKDDVTVNDFKVSIPGKVHLKKDDVVTNNFKVDLPGKVVIKAEDVVTPSTPIDIPVNAVISKKDDAGVIPSLNDEAAQISSLGEGLSEASKKVSDYQENLGAVGTTSQYAAQQMDWLNRALDEQIVDFDKLDEKIKKYLENLEKLNPVELNGRINIAMKDIIVPKKITLNGDLLIANATKEINEAAKKSETEKKKKSISTAKNEGSADSKKEKKEKKEKTPEELQKEYLLSFSGLYKKIMRTMNARDKSAGKLYDGTYVEDLDAFLSGKEFDSYLDDLKDRLKTTIGLLNGVSPDGGWRKDSIYRSAIKDGQHERKNYLYTERDKEDLLAAKKEQEDYLSALKNIPELRSKAFDAATNYGESSELYRLASEKLTAAEQLVASYENSHSEEFLNSISQRTDIKSAQWSEGLVASEKGIVDGIVQNIKKIQTLYNKRNGLFGDKDDDRLRDVNKEISEIVASTQQLIEQADSAGLDVSEIPRIMDSLNTFKAVKDSSDQKEKLSKQAKDDAKQAQKDKQLQNEIEAKKREYLKLLDERNKLLDEQANAAEDGLSQQAKADIAVGLFNKEAELNKVKSFLVNNMAGGDWNDFVKTKVDPKQQAYNRAGERKVNKEIAAEEKKNADDLARKAKEDESYIKKYEQSVGRYLKAKEKLNNANDPAEWYEADNEYKNALENMLGLEDYITGQSSITDNAEYFDRYEKAAYKAVLGENALAEALRKREEVQRAAIARNDEDLKSLNQFIAQVENMQGTLEKNLATDTPNYSSLLNLGNKGKSLFQFLDDNPIDKNLAAQLWGQNAGYDDIKTLEDAFARLRKEAAEAKIPVQEIRTEVEKLTKITRNKTRVANLSSELNDYLEKFPKVGSSLADEVRELQKALSDPDAWKNAGELGLKMAELRKHAKELGLESENLYDKFKKLFGQHLGTAIVMGALHKMQEATRVIYQNVVNIDTAMAELRKVTNLTSDGYKDFMNTAVEQATRLGVGIDEYINSTADWARLGYDSKEAENLATYSNLLRNVGDGIDDVNTASSYLISTLQGFKLDSSEVEHVVDVINSVANTQPITAEGIGEVLSRSSAAMSAAGNTLEETIALGVAANAVVQDADSVGKVYADVI